MQFIIDSLKFQIIIGSLLKYRTPAKKKTCLKMNSDNHYQTYVTRSVTEEGCRFCRNYKTIQMIPFKPNEVVNLSSPQTNRGLIDTLNIY